MTMMDDNDGWQWLLWHQNNHHLEDTGEEKDKGNQSNNTTDPARDGVHVQADDGGDGGDGGDDGDDGDGGDDGDDDDI